MASGDVVGYTSAGNSYYDIRIIWSTSSHNISNNTSTVTATAYLRSNGAGGFSGYTCAWTLTVNGVLLVSGSAKLFDWITDGVDRQFATGSTVVTHTTNGSKAISINATFDDTDNTESFLPKNVSYTITATLDDFSRPPLAPASGPTLGRTGTGGTISITSQAAASYAVATTATTQYDYRWNNDNGASWTTVTGTSSASFPNFTGTNPALVYYFQTRAINSEGTGPFSPSAVAYAAPSITSATSVGTTATVVLAAPASNGGSTINATTGYAIDYSTDSAFATFSTKSSAGVGSNSITGLLPGNTYYFRAKYVNSASVTSPYSASASTFIAAYGRRYATSGSITNVTTTTNVKTITSVFGGEFNTDFTTSAAHGFSTGQTVIVSGIAAPYAYLNQTYTNISVFGVNSFSTDANNDGLGTVSISGTATVTGDATYTASNSFSANDTVTITGVNPGAYNLTNATIKSATASSFVITSTAQGTYSNSTGTASGWARMLTGKRVASITPTKSGAITGFNGNTNNNIARYTVASGHGLAIGDVVTITGISAPYTSLNQTSVAITLVDTTYFDLGLNIEDGALTISGAYTVGPTPSNPTWTPITIAQKFSGSWSSFSN
jgi:hypothetical protein